MTRRVALRLAAARAYVVSLAFFDKGVLIGYDSPHLYVGAILAALALTGPLPSVEPWRTRQTAWGLFGITIVLSALAAVSPAEVAVDLAKTALSLGFGVLCWAMLGASGRPFFEMTRTLAWLGAGLGALAIAQLITFNLGLFVLEFPATNPAYMASGDAGAATGTLGIFRATGTVAEPSWLAFLLVPTTAMALHAALSSGTPARWARVGFNGAGLLASMSFVGIALFGLAAAALAGISMADRQTRSSLRRSLRPALVVLAAGTAAAVALSVALPRLAEYVRQRLSRILDGTDPSLQVRGETMAYGWFLFKSSPLFGIGSGNFKHHRELGTDVSIPSGFLLLLVEVGLVGTVAFVGILWASWKAAARLPGGLRVTSRLMVAVVPILMVSYNWWFHPLLWLLLAMPASTPEGSGVDQVLHDRDPGPHGPVREA